MLRRRDANRYDLERTFCVLRNERTLFHRVVSLGLLLAVDNTSATPTRTLEFPAGISSNSSSFESASKPIYGGSYGDGTVSGPGVQGQSPVSLTSHIERTRWTVGFLGFWQCAQHRSCCSSNTSILCKYTRRANGLQRATLLSGRGLACQR